jgi:hypothetical protein
VDALQGISVAQVAEGERERPGVGTVHIDGVTITSRIAPSVNRSGFGVFVGSCESLLVEGSRVEREANEATQNMDVNGIHVEGQLGRRAIVRHNHTERYRAGVFIGPRNKLPPPNAERRALPPGQAPLWLVADNTGRVEVTSPWVRVEGNVE